MKPKKFITPEDLGSYQATLDFISHLKPQIDLTCAQPRFPAPQNVFESAAKLKDSSQFNGSSRGQQSTLQECVNFAQRRGIPCGIQNIALNEHIFSGTSEIYKILKITANRGAIIAVAPIFGPHIQQLQDQEINCHIIHAKKEDGFLLNPDVLEKAILETGAKYLLLCDPNNPTTSVMTKKNAEEIAKILKKHNVITIIDAAFEMNLLEDKEPKDFASVAPHDRLLLAAVPGMTERTITFFGPSKAMAMPGGIRISFCVGKAEIISHLSKLGGHPMLHQKVLTAAIQDNKENRQFSAETRQEYLIINKLIQQGIEALNEKFGEIFGEKRSGEEAYVKPCVPNPKIGGIYLIDFSGLRGKIYGHGKEIQTGIDVAKWLSQNAKVDTIPGEGSLVGDKEILIRISTGHPLQILEQAFENIMEATTKKIRNVPGKSPNASNASLASTKELKMISKL
jgi:aspartate/methionine/tyrosine aminotransferase